MSAASDLTVPLLGLLGAFVAMTALGWTLGKGSNPPHDDGQAASQPGAVTAVDRARKRSASALRRVTAIRHGANQEDRMRATIELANSLPTSEFGEWIDGGWFDFRSGFELTLFRRILEERWRLEDPEGFVAWCLEDGRHGGGATVSNPRSAALPLLATWAVDAPERLKSFFDKHPDDGLEAQLIANLAEKDPKAALAQFQALLKRGVRDYQLQNALQKLAASAPEAVEAILDELPTSYRLQAESALIGNRLVADFENEFQALLERPDGWQHFSRNIQRLKNPSDLLLEQLPNLPASWRNNLVSSTLQSLFYQGNAEPWFRADLEGLGLTAEQAQRVRSYAMRSLASRKPEVALNLLSEGDGEESFRVGVIRDIFRQVRSKPEQAEQWMSQLSSEAELEAARNAIGTGNQATANQQPQYDTPDRWLEGALAGELDRNNVRTLGYALRRWDQKKLSELTERFQDLPVEARDAVAGIVARDGAASNMAQSSPELAGAVVRHLLNNGETPAPEGQRSSPAARLASATAVQWVVQNPTEATEWVASLPAGEAKVWAEKNMAASWYNYDPEAVADWITTLPTNNRTEVQTFLDERTGQ